MINNLFISAILDSRYKLVTQTYCFIQILGNEKGEEFVETFKKDMELLYK